MKQKIIELGKKAKIDIEIFEKTQEKVDINTMNGKEKLFQITNVTSYRIKAIKNEISIEYMTDNLKNPNLIIDNIQNIFKLQENKNKNFLCQGNLKHKLEQKETLDYNKIKQDFLNLIDLKKEYPLILNIETTYSHYINRYGINNKECSLTDETYYHEYGVAITIEKMDKKKVSFINFYSENYDFKSFYHYVREKLEYLILKINVYNFTTKKYNIILKNNAVALILNTFEKSFQSKEMEQNVSILSGKRTQKIFGDKITIVEDPKNGIEKRYFDTEGTITYEKELVKNGIFQLEINNLEYATKQNVKATGNAYGVNNLYIKSGDNSEQELIQKLNNGIIIDEIYGLHSGIDKKNGTISLHAEGLVVENGKITNGLEMIILSTNFFELFSNVMEIGKEYSHNLLCVSAPSLLLKNITIVGKK